MKPVAIDTNAYRALQDNNREVVKVLTTTPIIGIPIIVLGELYFGFEHGKYKESNTLRLETFLQNSRLQILNIDGQTARIFGEISAELEKKGKRIQQNDIWIAAICQQYNYSLLTADKGFANITGLDTITFC